MKSAISRLREALDSVYAWLVIHLVLAGALTMFFRFLIEPGLFRRLLIIIIWLLAVMFFLFACWLWYILRKWPHHYTGRDWQFIKDEWREAKGKSYI